MASIQHCVHNISRSDKTFKIIVSNLWNSPIFADIFYAMKRFVIVLFALSSFVASGQPAKWTQKKFFTVMSYNVENLFDTVRTEGKNDVEFTPSGKKNWNSSRYYEKLSHIAQAIDSVNPNCLPDIVALVEVETRQVLVDLSEQEPIKGAGYQCILEEGPDPRGIDCALMYNPNTFRYVSHKAINVRLKPSNKRTRDMLYVKGLVGKDTLHVFVNHWPSRVGGKDETASKRAQCADLLRQLTDSLYKANNDCNILIMGDMNDEPTDESVYSILGASELSRFSQLYNVNYAMKAAGRGTYFYNGEYSMLDNLIVSGNLVRRTKGFRLYGDTGFIFSPNFISYTDKKGNVMPSRSYSGNYYTGGFSDHYPVYMVFYKK